jgi:hypothetical protein
MRRDKTRSAAAPPCSARLEARGRSAALPPVCRRGVRRRPRRAAAPRRRGRTSCLVPGVGCTAPARPAECPAIQVSATPTYGALSRTRRCTPSCGRCRPAEPVQAPRDEPSLRVRPCPSPPDEEGVDLGTSESSVGQFRNVRDSESTPRVDQLALLLHGLHQPFKGIDLDPLPLFRPRREAHDRHRALVAGRRGEYSATHALEEPAVRRRRRPRQGRLHGGRQGRRHPAPRQGGGAQAVCGRHARGGDRHHRRRGGVAPVRRHRHGVPVVRRRPRAPRCRTAGRLSSRPTTC